MYFRDEDFIAKVKGELFTHRNEKSVNFRETQERIQSIVEVICREERIRSEEPQRGSGRQQVVEVCAQIAQQLADELGVSLKEIGYHLAVSSSAISKILGRKSV